MDRQSHTQEGIDARRQAVALAREMLRRDGVDLIVGCRRMWRLLSDITDHSAEPFMIFAAVDSETDHLALEVSPELLDADHRARSLEEGQRVATLYKAAIHEACLAVIARYADA